MNNKNDNILMPVLRAHNAEIKQLKECVETLTQELRQNERALDEMSVRLAALEQDASG